jgi:peptide/nickel transport system substrate-binding protein
MSIYNLNDFERLFNRKLNQHNEAPILLEKVKRGLLPPVRDRLPDNPLVIVPWEETGTYGGMVRYLEINTNFCNYMRHINESELLETGPSDRYHHYSRIDGPVLPGILEKWESNETGTVHTFCIRKGLKWSDGIPVTTEDVLYAYNDVIMDEEIYPLLTNSEGSVVFLPEWEWIAWGGKQTRLEVLDKYSFSFVFGQPYPAFVIQQIRNARWHMLLRPKHYLSQFHKQYARMEKLEMLMNKKGFSKNEWGKFYFSIDPPVREAGYMIPSYIPDIENYPTLDPWMFKPGYSQKEAELERNPYYYKIDTEGNQLPYIDRIKRSVVENTEVMYDKIVAGESDIQTNFLRLKDYPYLMKHSEKAGYRGMLLNIWQVQMLAATINLCPDDEEIRRVVQDIRFRRALSLSINRTSIRDSIFLGYGRPAQATTSSRYTYYRKEFEKAYMDYDPAEADRLLDEMKLDKRDEDGCRLLPDGKRLELLLAYFEVTPPAEDGAEAISGFWKAVGIRIQVLKLKSGHEWGMLQVQNKIIFTVWEMVGGDPLIPYHEGGMSDSTPLWWKWYESKGVGGIEPLPAAKKLYAYREIIKATNNLEKRIRAAEEIYRLQAENLWIIGTVAGAPQPLIYSNRLGNIECAEKRGYFNSTVLGAAEQWYFKA